MRSCASLWAASVSCQFWFCQHEAQALAMEYLIIRMLAPSAKRADQIQASALHGHGVLLKPTKVAERRRPFPRFRAAHGAALSIWTVPHFIDIAQRELDHPTAAPAMEDCRHIRGSFSLLYWGNQRHVLIERAEHGPISIFTPGYLILLLAYTSTAKPCVNLPPSWDRPTRARLFCMKLGKHWRKGSCRIQSVFWLPGQLAIC